MTELLERLAELNGIDLTERTNESDMAERIAELEAALDALLKGVVEDA